MTTSLDTIYDRLKKMDEKLDVVVPEQSNQQNRISHLEHEVYGKDQHTGLVLDVKKLKTDVTTQTNRCNKCQEQKKENKTELKWWITTAIAILAALLSFKK